MAFIKTFPGCADRHESSEQNGVVQPLKLEK
jgi:hypothetical protein